MTEVSVASDDEVHVGLGESHFVLAREDRVKLHLDDDER